MSKPEILLESQRFLVERVGYTAADGQPHHRDVVRHPGSVVIVPELDDGRICLIRNYRVATACSLVELPAGTRETGEPPDHTAARELTEETGYRAGRLQRITAFYAAPGILDEEMVLFHATDLVPGAPQREPGEQIENLLVSREDARQMIRTGAIRDAKTIVGLLLTDPKLPF